MTRPVWLTEAEVRRQGMDRRPVTYREVAKGPAPVPPGACATVYGTSPTVRLDSDRTRPEDDR